MFSSLQSLKTRSISVYNMLLFMQEIQIRLVLKNLYRNKRLPKLMKLGVYRSKSESDKNVESTFMNISFPTALNLKSYI